VRGRVLLHFDRAAKTLGRFRYDRVLIFHYSIFVWRNALGSCRDSIIQLGTAIVRSLLELGADSQRITCFHFRSVVEVDAVSRLLLAWIRALQNSVIQACYFLWASSGWFFARWNFLSICTRFLLRICSCWLNFAHHLFGHNHRIYGCFWDFSLGLERLFLPDRVKLGFVNKIFHSVPLRLQSAPKLLI